MSVNPNVVAGLFIAGIVLFFLAIAAVMITGMLWLDRSDSPRAANIRRLLGGRARKRDDGSKKWHWTGESKILRRAAARDFAAKYGYAYNESEPSRLARLVGAKGVVHTNAGEIEDVLRRDDVTIATYTWRSFSDHTAYTVLFVDGVTVPAFHLSTETIVHKAGYGGTDIDFADDPQFSEIFHLASDGDVKARQLFGRDVRAEFVRAGHCVVESNGTTLLFVEQEQTTRKGYEMFVGESLRLRDKLVAAAASLG